VEEVEDGERPQRHRETRARARRGRARTRAHAHAHTDNNMHGAYENCGSYGGRSDRTNRDSHSPSVLWMFMLQPTSMLHVP